jgi:hypothetical protein
VAQRFHTVAVDELDARMTGKKERKSHSYLHAMGMENTVGDIWPVPENPGKKANRVWDLSLLIADIESCNRHEADLSVADKLIFPDTEPVPVGGINADDREFMSGLGELDQLENESGYSSCDVMQRIELVEDQMPRSATCYGTRHVS